MYLQNKYTNWYNNIITNAKSRNLHTRKQAKKVLGYPERHHIIPKSLSGSDHKENLIFLTAKEHYICHLLLPKMTEGSARRSMCHALWNIVNQHRDYQHRHRVTSRMYESIKKTNAQALSMSNTGKPNLKLQGRVVDQNWRSKIKETLLAGNYKGVPKPTKQCKHCGQVFAGHIISRFHNDKCKSLLPEIPKKERVAWNRGLTKHTDARIAEIGRKMSIIKTGVKRGSCKTNK